MGLRIVEKPKPKLVIKRQEPKPETITHFFHLHAHSHYSIGDAISPVDKMIQTAKGHGQPALALTDHGNMGGVVQLYQGCKEEGLVPFPGVEAYLVEDKTDPESKKKRFHLGLVAFTTKGYEDLCRINTQANLRENFHHKPLIDLGDLAEFNERGFSDGIALTTGCYFGLVIQRLVHQGYESMKNVLKMYSAWFPHTFVELQAHEINQDPMSEWAISDYLTMGALELGLPMVVTNDAHYCELDEKPIHEHLKQLVSWGPDPDDAVFPGDGFHLCHESWVRDHHGKVQWDKGLEGLQRLLDMHDLIIPQLEKYHYRVPTTVQDPMSELKNYAISIASTLGLTSNRYLDRLDEEIDVIEASEMGGYLWLVKEVTDWCREHDVFYTTRGSASGSLVCFLLGITQLDPLKYNLRFDRFLSKDRTKPPDIDLDVEDVRRDDVITWLRERFNVCTIGTYGTFSVDAEEGKGSLMVSYLSKLRKQGKDVSHIKGLHDLPQEDQKNMHELSRQKVRKSYGTHAAGLVVTSTKEEFESLVPTMLVASSNTTVTQYEQDDIEALGLVKLDILGNRNLTTLRRCVELLGHDVSHGFDWIPLNDKATFSMLKKGDTEGIFQLEGYTAKRGCEEMKVKNYRDVMHILALYRPAVMSSGTKDAYIRRRRKSESYELTNEIFARHFQETHGLPIFQEQTVGVLRDLGFDREELTAFLKAVKASNNRVEGAQGVIESYREKYLDLSSKAGWSDEDVKWMWEVVEGFAEYGFNKAHAAAYALLSTRLAYLKANHPLEFAAALLQTVAGKAKKEKPYLRMVRGQMKISILKPDVNVSGKTWTIDYRRTAIRKGLVSIPGIGSKAVDALIEVRGDDEFTSVKDLCQRAVDAGHTRSLTGVKGFVKSGEYKGTIKDLYDAGALDEIRGEGE